MTRAPGENREQSVPTCTVCSGKVMNWARRFKELFGLRRVQLAAGLVCFFSAAGTFS
jgi:hypothetical protein